MPWPAGRRDSARPRRVRRGRRPRSWGGRGRSGRSSGRRGGGGRGGRGCAGAAEGRRVPYDLRAQRVQAGCQGRVGGEDRVVVAQEGLAVGGRARARACSAADALPPVVPESSAPEEQPARRAAPAAETSRLLLRGPARVRGGEGNGTADVLGGSYERNDGKGSAPVITVPAETPDVCHRLVRLPKGRGPCRCAAPPRERDEPPRTRTRPAMSATRAQRRPGPPPEARVDGNTPRDRIPFVQTRALPTTAHAAEESPG